MSSIGWIETTPLVTYIQLLMSSRTYNHHILEDQQKSFVREEHEDVSRTRATHN